MSREWCYKNIKPRIIAEVFLEDKTGLQSNGMVDYKLFMFNGELNFIMTCTERSSKGPLRNYFEADWSPLVRQGIPMENETSEVIPKPKNLSKMVEIAKTLSEDTRLLRVDFYEVNGELYVGEVTFFTLGGFKNYVPSVYNEIFGNNLKL